MPDKKNIVSTIEVKSEALRDVLRQALGDMRAVSLGADKPTVSVPFCPADPSHPVADRAQSALLHPASSQDVPRYARVAISTST